MGASSSRTAWGTSCVHKFFCFFWSPILASRTYLCKFFPEVPSASFSLPLLLLRKPRQPFFFSLAHARALRPLGTRRVSSLLSCVKRCSIICCTCHVFSSQCFLGSFSSALRSFCPSPLQQKRKRSTMPCGLCGDWVEEPPWQECPAPFSSAHAWFCTCRALLGSHIFRLQCTCDG